MKLQYMLCGIFLWMSFAFSATKPISLDLENVNLADALRLVATLSHQSVVISPVVSGTVTLHLAAVDPRLSLEALLSMYGLAKTESAGIWFISTQEELVKRVEKTVKYVEATEAALPLETKVWQVRYARANDIAQLLGEGRGGFLTKRGQLRVDMRTNKICLQDIHASVSSVQNIIKKLDIPVQQVLIAARLVSIDSAYEKELGVNFNVHTPWSDNEKASIIKQLNYEIGVHQLAVSRLIRGAWLDIKLSALESAGHAKLISNPSLLTANQQTASIEAGEEVPYQETSENGGTSIVFKKAVLGLKVTPQILPGKKVLLRLQINQDRASQKMVLGMPTISTRQIVADALVANGQTIVLGGVYETDQENGQRRIPFFSDLPIVGMLFKENTQQENRRQLLVFITPSITA
ncbi:MAG TPA: secretin N-terminal domain-containing protein [Gammaproteobacteria bacterium]|jgi:type IV pilus assembly protein PilQ|nr:secretin N-terminal domain-containing protein [Gammaproteobacteria bacterium]